MVEAEKYGSHLVSLIVTNNPYHLISHASLLCIAPFGNQKVYGVTIRVLVTIKLDFFLSTLASKYIRVLVLLQL